MDSRLKALFDIDELCSPKGRVFMRVNYRDKNGQGYGSSRVVAEEDLEDRKYRFGLYHNGNPFIEVLDAVFDEESWSAPNPIIWNNSHTCPRCIRRITGPNRRYIKDKRIWVHRKCPKERKI